MHPCHRQAFAEFAMMLHPVKCDSLNELETVSLNHCVCAEQQPTVAQLLMLLSVAMMRLMSLMLGARNVSGDNPRIFHRCGSVLVLLRILRKC